MKNTIKDVILSDLSFFNKDDGDLVVMEHDSIPFSITRVFNICAKRDAVRGNHAHYKCSQFLTCPFGSVKVICDDGNQTDTYILDHPRKGLLIPPGIWGRQTYENDNSVLTVLCDRSYEADDYIHDYTNFLSYRKNTEL